MHRKHHYLVLPPEITDGRYVPIGPEPILIGRNPTNRVRLPDTTVSGLHARVSREYERVFIEDLGSPNGTFLDDLRVETKTPFPVGAVLQIGRNLLRHEMLDAEEIRRRQMVSSELQRATTYVRSLLPAPLTEPPVRTEWRFIPSASLGGDAFGYHWLDGRHFCFFLLDVCGHGAAAALHSVAVVHVLRKQNLRKVDFQSPSEVLTALNRTFPMEEHGRLFLTGWYGVFDREDRRLVYACGGHPPALLTSPDASPRTLGSTDFPVGMMAESAYATHEAEVPPGSRMYLYSDGTFEVRTREGDFLSVPELHGIFSAATAGPEGEAERVERAVRSRMSEHDFADDLSLLVLHFD